MNPISHRHSRKAKFIAASESCRNNYIPRKCVSDDQPTKESGENPADAT
jgi:hypothetical protein